MYSYFDSLVFCNLFRFAENRLRVVLGRTFRLQNSSSEQIFDVEKYWIHEQYDDETYDNDIGETYKSHGNQILMITKTSQLWQGYCYYIYYVFKYTLLFKRLGFLSLFCSPKLHFFY